MNVDISKHDGITVVRVTGVVDSGNAKEFDSAVIRELDNGAALVAFDFAPCDYMSSAGIRILLLSAKRLLGTGGSMVITGLNAYMGRVFEIAGLGAILTIAPTLDDGIAVLAKNA